MKLKRIFKIIQGHQITDEEIYKNRGEIPVITGRNEIKGFWNKSIIEGEDLPCITYPTKANSGEAYVQNKIFDANNTAILIPFYKWKDKLDLYWVAYKLSKIFLDIPTSKDGVSYLNREIVEEVDIEIPRKKMQSEEFKSILQLLLMKEKLEQILNKINKIKNSELIFEYKDYQAKDFPATDIFDCIGGNSGLTEQYVYQNLQMKKEKKFILLTGSSEMNKKDRISLLPNPKNKTKEISTFSGEGIHVIRKGKAGRINYLDKDNYTSNDDAYILKIKDDCNIDISLKWLTKVYEKKFREFSSKSDNGTWNKTSFFEEAKFNIPSISEQKDVLNKFEILDNYRIICNKLLEKMNVILEKERNYN